MYTLLIFFFTFVFCRESSSVLTACFSFVLFFSSIFYPASIAPVNVHTSPASLIFGCLWVWLKPCLLCCLFSLCLHVFPICFLSLTHLFWLICAVSSNSSLSESSVYLLSLQTLHSLLTPAPVHHQILSLITQDNVSPLPTHWLQTMSSCRYHLIRHKLSLLNPKLPQSPSRPQYLTRFLKPALFQILPPNQSLALPASFPCIQPHPRPFPHPSSLVLQFQTAPMCNTPIFLPALSSQCPVAQYCLGLPSVCTTSMLQRRCLPH